MGSHTAAGRGTIKQNSSYTGINQSHSLSQPYTTTACSTINSISHLFISQPASTAQANRPDTCTYQYNDTGSHSDVHTGTLSGLHAILQALTDSHTWVAGSWSLSQQPLLVRQHCYVLLHGRPIGRIMQRPHSPYVIPAGITAVKSAASSNEWHANLQISAIYGDENRHGNKTETKR